MSKYRYSVAIAVGGVMEKPDYTYEDFETVEADSDEEAINKYEEKHPHNYWFATVRGKTRVTGVVQDTYDSIMEIIENYSEEEARRRINSFFFKSSQNL